MPTPIGGSALLHHRDLDLRVHLVEQPVGDHVGPELLDGVLELDLTLVDGEPQLAQLESAVWLTLRS